MTQQPIKNGKLPAVRRPAVAALAKKLKTQHPDWSDAHALTIAKAQLAGRIATTTGDQA